MWKKDKNKIEGWSKGKPVTRRMVNGLTKELDKASKVRGHNRVRSEVIIREESKSYRFRELG